MQPVWRRVLVLGDPLLTAKTESRWLASYALSTIVGAGTTVTIYRDFLFVVPSVHTSITFTTALLGIVTENDAAEASYHLESPARWNNTQPAFNIDRRIRTQTPGEC